MTIWAVKEEKTNESSSQMASPERSTLSRSTDLDGELGGRLDRKSVV